MKIKRAILFAAGQGKRLKKTKPKALLNINGEVLIEKIINNLISANVKEIIIITGYLNKEFLYLKDKYKNLKFVYNEHYLHWSTAYAGYLVEKYLTAKTILISADMFMTVNFFNTIDFVPTMAAIKRKTIKYDWIYKLDDNNNIIGYDQSDNVNDLVLGEWSLLDRKWAGAIRRKLKTIAKENINYLSQIPMVEVLITSAVEAKIVLKPYLLDENEQWDIDVEADLEKAYNFKQ